MQKVRLFTPGPTPVPPEVQLAIAQPIDHHRTSGYRNMLKAVSEGMMEIFQTKKGTVLTITGSGTAAMEGGIVSCAAPGKKALVVEAGKFGERWGQVCRAYDIPCTSITMEWGKAVDAGEIEKHLKADPDIGMVIVTHCETSTATVVDLEKIAKVVHDNSDALILVDGITAVGAIPLKMDEWGLDVVVVGSQKALMMPPGLAFAAVSDKAWGVIDSFKSHSLYLDYRAYRKSLSDWDAPYTPANTLVNGVKVAIDMILDDGIESVWKRTSLLAKGVRAGFEAMNLKLYSSAPSDSVSAAWVPDSVDESKFRKMLRSDYGMQVAGGQGQIKGKVFRITHMGYVDQIDMYGCLGGIEAAMLRCGHTFEPGAGLAAMQKVFCSQ